MKLSIQTPAKINLGLSILEKRSDGFHELDTIFQMVNLYDSLEFESQPANVLLTCNDSNIPTDSSNLICKAAQLLKNHFPENSDKGCKIHLKKKIPVGAGLGGGSGNAAGALMGLNYLWDLGLRREQLLEISAQLGSDVPFFLCSPAARGQGRGEKLTPLQPFKKCYVILVFPKIFVSTSEVYQHLNLNLTKNQKNISILSDFFSQSDIVNLGANLVNDLETVVLKRYPVVQMAKDRLRSFQPQGLLVSGSGSSVFGMFQEFDSAKRAFAECSDGDWDVFFTETVSQFSEFLPESVLNYP